MRISDWSSDVCSSDLLDRRIIQLKIEREALKKETDTASRERLGSLEKELHELEERAATLTADWQAEKDKQIGRASCRERVCQYVSLSVVAVPVIQKDTNTTHTQHPNTQ